ncbi:MAG: type II toxin-antitoxin system RelE/ParE family toxin [Bauldia sp.]|nr:type II toxin-antitoxin system RelE/ParE family toxin [Bauldia sp.]
MTIRLSPRALRDTESILAYLLERSPAAAIGLRESLARSIEAIGVFPAAGRECLPGVRVTALRRYPYLVYWRVERDGVTVLHIRHASRRPWRGIRS